MLWRGGGGYTRRQRGRQKTKRARRSVLFCGGLGRLSRGVHMDTAALAIKMPTALTAARCFWWGWWIYPSGHKPRLHLSPTNKNRPAHARRFLVGDGGFEPPKALPADLQSVPFGHSGNPPNIRYSIGAGGRIRTPDLLITNQLLYQLSYTSISPANRIITEVSRIVNKKVYQETKNLSL